MSIKKLYFYCIAIFACIVFLLPPAHGSLYRLNKQAQMIQGELKIHQWGKKYVTALTELTKDYSLGKTQEVIFTYVFQRMEYLVVTHKIILPVARKWKINYYRLCPIIAEYFLKKVLERRQFKRV